MLDVLNLIASEDAIAYVHMRRVCKGITQHAVTLLSIGDIETLDDKDCIRWKVTYKIINTTKENRECVIDMCTDMSNNCKILTHELKCKLNNVRYLTNWILYSSRSFAILHDNISSNLRGVFKLGYTSYKISSISETINDAIELLVAYRADGTIGSEFFELFRRQESKSSLILKFDFVPGRIT